LIFTGFEGNDWANAGVDGSQMVTAKAMVAATTNRRIATPLLMF